MSNADNTVAVTSPITGYNSFNGGPCPQGNTQEFQDSWEMARIDEQGVEGDLKEDARGEDLWHSMNKYSDY